MTEYAPYRITQSGTVTELRLREDRAFANLLSATLHDLTLTDAPQRLQIDVSGISTTRELGAQDLEPRAAIAHHISDLLPDLLFAPLALGDHIDHRIAQAAVLDHKFPAVAFYEDLPYAARLPRSACEERAAQLDRNLTPYTIHFPNGREWKRRCAALYPSQISPATVDEIADYSLHYQEGERFWVTAPAAEILASFEQA